MHVYRFRILADEDDKFFREIEIKPAQTFLDFHKILQECGEFSDNEMASFYICDGNWNKLQEITLLDMGGENIDDDDEEESSAVASPALLMESTRISQCINDPHQRMIYVYDFLNMWTFYIELFKIVPATDGAQYPRCIKCQGKLDKKVKGITDIRSIDEDAEELLTDTNDIFRDDNSFEQEDTSLFGDPSDDNSYN